MVVLDNLKGSMAITWQFKIYIFFKKIPQNKTNNKQSFFKFPLMHSTPLHG